MPCSRACWRLDFKFLVLGSTSGGVPSPPKITAWQYKAALGNAYTPSVFGIAPNIRPGAMPHLRRQLSGFVPNLGDPRPRFPSDVSPFSLANGSLLLCALPESVDA